jgi:hypothetical protein
MAKSQIARAVRVALLSANAASASVFGVSAYARARISRTVHKAKS